MALTTKTPVRALAAVTLTLSLTSSLALASDAPDGTKKVSNETTLSRYANPNDTGPIRRAPDRASGVLAHLKINTEDHLPNVYLVLREMTDPASGAVWYEVRIPGRPNGRTGWVQEDDLGPLQAVTTQLIVDRHTLRATLYRKGHKIF